jgi:hypothetical protein
MVAIIIPKTEKTGVSLAVAIAILVGNARGFPGLMLT